MVMKILNFIINFILFFLSGRLGLGRTGMVNVGEYNCPGGKSPLKHTMVPTSIDKCGGEIIGNSRTLNSQWASKHFHKICWADCSKAPRFAKAAGGRCPMNYRWLYIDELKNKDMKALVYKSLGKG